MIFRCYCSWSFVGEKSYKAQSSKKQGSLRNVSACRSRNSLSKDAFLSLPTLKFAFQFWMALLNSLSPVASDLQRFCRSLVCRCMTRNLSFGELTVKGLRFSSFHNEICDCLTRPLNGTFRMRDQIFPRVAKLSSIQRDFQFLLTISLPIFVWICPCWK